MATITGYKDIAAAIARESGTTCSERTARAYAARTRDPLPVKRWGRNVGVDFDELRRWVGRQWKSRARMPESAA
jgi:hypothetical protein